MPSSFTHIAIIFNPESSGDAAKLAQQLSRDLQSNGFSSTLEPTNHAGHATEIAKHTSLQYRYPLIVSVSGDGGYNEVINGAMAAKAESKQARPVVSVLGAGNANDHYRVMHDDTIVDLVRNHSVQPLDLVSISASNKNFTFKRYAHSYIGFGITPEVGNELNRHGKGVLSELKLVIKTFMRFRPFEITYDGKSRLCDSLVFANINEMAKVVKLDDTNTINDGKFELIEFAHRGKLTLLANMVKAAIIGTTKPVSYKSYRFTTKDKIPVQSDGEIDHLPENTAVTIQSHSRAIDSLFSPPSN